MMLLQLPPDARRLADYMSDLSEQAYCAGWMLGLEFALWEAVLTGPLTYGGLQITAAHIAELKRLSTAAGGWIVFDDEDEEILVPFDEWGRRFESRRGRTP